ncbi:MAG TPA: PilZ domain-containing protein [Pseudobacteroides sp.]|nr:PilZ domain-containing protein [Pseudobacteroides sp.]
MRASEITTGTKLEIQFVDFFMGDKEITKLFVSEFECAEEEDVICVASPIYEGTYLPAPIGTDMFVFAYFTGQFYKFKAKLKDKLIKDGLPIYKLSINGDMEKIQRRQFFRLECMLGVRCREVKIENNIPVQKGDFLNGFTRDISGGGACLVLAKGIEIGKYLECEIQITGNKMIKFYGTVIRSVKFDVDNKSKYELGVEFYNIDNRTREAIIGFIFEEQRKLRKKGLI